jgi:RNA polymerase sigma-70 factor (ECF subfamily)
MVSEVSESQVRRMPFTLRPAADAGPAVDRLSSLFHQHFDLVWRTVRRLGVPPGAVDDAAQEVFVIASRKLAVIEPGKEKAFLYGVAIRVAADARRANQRRGTASDVEPDILIDSSSSSADELVDQKRARELLDAIIQRMPEDARDVFVLYELEGLTMAEIATALELAAGTVASRLRRARELFAAAVARLESRQPGAARKGPKHG